MQIAYRELWRHGWPDTLDAALQHQHLRVCITGLARQRQRQRLVAWPAHTLPRLAAPPTPPGIGKPAHGRSEYSLAVGPKTDLSSWKGRSPKAMMGLPFDAKKAAAHDLDN